MLVKIYSTSTCPACDMVKAFLNKHKIKFMDVNVADDEAGRQEMIDKTGQFGVPVTIISNEKEKIILGFDPAELKKTLNL